MTDAEKIAQLVNAVRRALDVILVHENTIQSLANSNAALRHILKQQGFLTEYDAAYHQAEHDAYPALQKITAYVQQGLDFLNEV
jgi:ribosomal protein S8